MEELDLKELFDLFMSKIFQILIIVIVFIGIGVVYTLGFVDPKYSAKTTLVLASAGGSETSNAITTTDVNLNSKLVSTYSEIVRSDAVVGTVIKNLELSIKDNDLKKQVSVSAVEDADIIRITVTNEDADEAAKIANEIAKVFSDKIKELYKINNINVLDQAIPNYTPSNINHTKDVIIFAFIGVVISVAYVLIANMLDTTIKSTEDIEKGFGIPVLVSIPLIDNITNVKGGKRK
ncbi:MAG TPA: hypothetical protein DEP51_04695 [Clostridiales bacterium]|nr:hypothetical protein [Clostridiales bacterium]